MNLRKLMITGLMATLLIGGVTTSTSVNAATSSSYTESKSGQETYKSAKNLKQLGLSGNWYSMSSKTNGMNIAVNSEGMLNWYPLNGTGNNTAVMGVQTYKGWTRLNLQYPDKSEVYGFMKISKLKINKKTYKVLLFGTNNSKTPKKLSIMTATRSKNVVMPKKQLTKNVTIK